MPKRRHGWLRAEVRGWRLISGHPSPVSFRRRPARAPQPRERLPADFGSHRPFARRLVPHVIASSGHQFFLTPRVLCSNESLLTRPKNGAHGLTIRGHAQQPNTAREPTRPHESEHIQSPWMHAICLIRTYDECPSSPTPDDCCSRLSRQSERPPRSPWNRFRLLSAAPQWHKHPFASTKSSRRQD